MSKVAIPLVLPNNCTWDAQTGTYDKKKGVGRETLNAIPKALDQLREIKGPVCVVSIAGPCRMGKSYILSKAFDQGEVFPLGHYMDPETMGIWLWIVPQKFQDSTGRDFTVILLDSEGVDSVYAKQADDHRIFTLSVLLSSILIYNSAGVPNRSDLEGLDFIVKLSQRIQLYNKKKNATDKDESHFYEAFPNFIWLLRDAVLRLPKKFQSVKEYFLKKVLNADNEELNKDARKTADSILNFFSGFDAFSLPPPSPDPEVVTNLNDKSLESQVNPQFLKEVQAFKKMLHSKLSPKKSINEGEFVTGEALAALIQLFVEALNTPGTVPNVENAWDTFVHNKCAEVLAAALAAYKQEMTSQMKEKIPCEADVIRAAHLKAMDAGFETFRKETFNLSIKSVDKYLNELREKADVILSEWIEQNTRETEACCNQLLKELKQSMLDPVLKRLRGPEASKMQFSDIVSAYNQIQESYAAKARGAKDVQATVFMNFHPELKSEMEKNIDILQRMKDFDASLAREKAEKSALEEQRLKQKEDVARLEKEKQVKEKELVLLQKKQEEERIRLEQMFEKKLKEHKEQMDNMLQANFEVREQERKDALARQKPMEDMLEVLKEKVETRDGMINMLREEIKQQREAGLAVQEKMLQLTIQAMQEGKDDDDSDSDSDSDSSGNSCAII
ncbi:LOW QUALITY PROTEIN: guanylate-binding protein 4-like [Actinia tenebrosa]|uniref:LOW QUALITY PROTEIN: guanylate-binding protein 4-like n=1 Tax=Actinia tenebrosa TaxID=6105 RepID=A0A6P8INV6_ACTTE|nr:LOW QUALITY PROTEIN: guanylate-binding protein 4-like [Actinia tenebrosa]